MLGSTCNVLLFGALDPPKYVLIRMSQVARADRGESAPRWLPAISTQWKCFAAASVTLSKKSLMAASGLASGSLVS
jgi:hypothetical protein